jgi:sugar phosphate isomerase/epimerase
MMDGHDVQFAATAEWLSFVDEPTPANAERVMIDTAAALAGAGFAWCELPLPHAACVFEAWGEAGFAEAGAAMREAGCAPLSVHGPDLGTLDDDTDDVIARTVTYARLTAAVGASVLVVHPARDSHPHVCDRHAALWARDTAVCRAVGEGLRGTGVTLAVENLPTYGSAYLVALLNAVNHPHVGACFDTGHWWLRPEGTLSSLIAALDTPPGRLAHLHLSDNDGLCDAHRPPGAGTFPWARFTAALPRRWRHTPVVVELSAPLRRDRPDAADAAGVLWRDAAIAARTCWLNAWKDSAPAGAEAGPPEWPRDNPGS